MAAEDARDPKDPLSRYLAGAMGLTELTRKRAEKVVRSLTQQGEAGGSPKALVENLLERSHENREALVTLVRSETKRAMKAMGLATANDVERLEQQLKSLRRELADRDAGPSDAQERAKRTAAKKTSKKAAKKAAKKTSKKAAKKTGKKAAKKSTKKSSS